MIRRAMIGALAAGLITMFTVGAAAAAPEPRPPTHTAWSIRL